MNLYEYLQTYGQEGRIPMHMPGHKRNAIFSMNNPYAWDVTEVEGTDNLYHPEGILKQELERLKNHYGTKDSYMLVNGSTCGILTAIAACCRRGDRILVARNCHKSVYHAIFLLELTPVYLYPDVDEKTGILLDVPAKQIEDVLEQETVSCVVLTSPTYEGVVSDIEAIANVCHNKDIPLIVDEAHGAHFAWSEKFPLPAMEQGADLVIESLHKTLPCLTQTALLHRVTDRVPRDQLERFMAVFQTSSPSYVLMAGISQCVSWLQEKGESAWDEYEKMLSAFQQEADKWKHLSLWRHERQECSKLVIGTWGTNITGVELGQRLRTEYKIEVEMESSHYVLAMTSVGDEAVNFQRLAWALTQIDETLTDDSVEEIGNRKSEPIVRMSLYEAVYCKHRLVPLADSIGLVAAEYAFIYPPGIPFLVPGEEITENVCVQIQEAKERGLTLLGLEDDKAMEIKVCE